MKDTLNIVTMELQKNPAIGLGGGVSAGLLYWIELVSPILSFFGACLGVGIAAITLHLKLIEWKTKRKQLREEDNNIN